MTGLFAVQVPILLLLSATKTFSITAPFLAVDSLQSTTTGSIVLAPATQHLFDINLAYLLTVILSVGVLGHLAVATIYRNKYDIGLQQKRNPARWVQYSVSCGLSAVTVALLVGMFDVVSLLMVFGTVAASCLMMLLLERSSTSKAKSQNLPWLSYAVAIVAGGLAWLAIILYMIFSEINGAGQTVYIYALVASQLVLCGVFAANLVLGLKQYRQWKGHSFTERNFMLINLALCTGLVWLAYLGALR